MVFGVQYKTLCRSGESLAHRSLQLSGQVVHCFAGERLGHGNITPFPRRCVYRQTGIPSALSDSHGSFGEWKRWCHDGRRRSRHRKDPAARRLREALQFCRDAGYLPELAHLCLCLAETLLSDGDSNTVANHLRHLYEKAGLSNRAEAAAYALRHGLDA